jgi:hypothetical protein
MFGTLHLLLFSDWPFSSLLRLFVCTRQIYIYIYMQVNCCIWFYVLLTVHLGPVLVNNQLDAQFFFSYIFIPILHMFRTPLCSSSGESIVLIRYLVHVNYVGDRLVCRIGRKFLPNLHTWRSELDGSSIQTCTLDGQNWMEVPFKPAH